MESIVFCRSQRPTCSINFMASLGKCLFLEIELLNIHTNEYKEFRQPFNDIFFGKLTMKRCAFHSVLMKAKITFQ